MKWLGDSNVYSENGNWNIYDKILAFNNLFTLFIILKNKNDSVSVAKISVLSNGSILLDIMFPTSFEN